MMLIVIFVIMIVPVMRMDAVMMIGIGLFVGGRVEPGAAVGLGVGRIEPLTARSSLMSKAGSSMRDTLPPD